MLTVEWVAGFVEGDGAVCWGAGTPRLQVVQANKAVLLKLKCFFGFGKVYPRRNLEHTIKPKRGKFKAQWVYQAATRQCLAALERLYPHFVTGHKKQQARKVFKYYTA